MKSLTRHKGSNHCHTLDSNSRFLNTFIYSYKLLKTTFGKQTFVLNTHVAINVESCSDTSCSRTDQFIRAQVQCQPPEWSRSHTWAHINLVVRRVSRRTSKHPTYKPKSYMMQHPCHMLHKVHKYSSSIEYELRLLQTMFSKIVAKAN